jgi:DNA-binding transcriptional regulator YiaG
LLPSGHVLRIFFPSLHYFYAGTHTSPTSSIIIMSGLPFLARALFDYDAVESTELSMTTGDSVMIEEVNASGWSLARQQNGDGHVGWIPTEYIEKVDSSGAGLQGTDAEISVERPQPSPQSASQAIELSANSSLDSKAMSALLLPGPATTTRPSSDSVEDDVAALVIRDTTHDRSAASASTAAASSTAPLPCPVDIASAVKITTTGSSSQSSAPPALPPSTTKVCAHCHETIKSAFVMARDVLFHPQHFLCHACAKPLGGKAYLEGPDRRFYCESDYYSLFNPKCGQCQQTIHGPYISALGQCWHPQHFVCHHCSQPFPSGSFRQHDGRPYCDAHYQELHAPKCQRCSKPIVGSVFEALEHKYHLECFVCSEGEHSIGEGQPFHQHEGKVYCSQHFEAKFLQTCHRCQQRIKSQFIRLGENEYYHTDCWQCAQCHAVLRVDNCSQLNSQFYCKNCANSVNTSSKRGSVITTTKPPAAAAATAAPAPAAVGAGSKRSSVNGEVVPVDDTDATKPSATTAAQPSAAPAIEPAVISEPDAMGSVPYAVLKDSTLRPAGINPIRKEQYLSDDEFVTVFGVSKADFSRLPEWKRAEHKKRHGLF